MRHAGAESLGRLEPLLADLRGLSGLKERATGVFYARGAAALHFHEDPAGLFADLKQAGEWRRYALATDAERARLLAEARRSFG